MIPGKLGSHVSISDETVLYPNFTRLLTLWAEGFSEERFGQIMGYTTITLARTQRGTFSSMEDCTGTAMIVDVDDAPTGGYYVRDTGTNSGVRTHSSKYGPLLVQIGEHEYSAIAHTDSKTMIVFSIIRDHQTCPRSTWIFSCNYECRGADTQAPLSRD